jgi:hypothetical protein
VARQPNLATLLENVSAVKARQSRLVAMSDELRLLPAEVLPEAERRAWSRRHPVRVSLGRSLLVTPFVAVVIVLAPGVSWAVRVGVIVLAAIATFAVSWCALRLQGER